MNIAQLEAQYNNRALVADSARILAGWAERSAQVRAAYGSAAMLDMRYGRGRNQTVDVFPSDHVNAPILVFIHGGYWRALDKSDHSFIAPAFHAYPHEGGVRGAHVVVPNYALCPQVRIADIALQMVQLVLWVRDHAPRWQADARHVVLVGHSAGAHLAAMLLACDWKSLGCATPPVTRALGLSGVYDLRPLVGLPFLQSDLRLTDAEAERVSPALWPAPKGVRFIAQVGGKESAEFRRQNRLIGQAWGAAAVPVCEEIAGFDHFTVLESLVQEGGVAHGAALRLLAA
jgi:arylformamidase